MSHAVVGVRLAVPFSSIVRGRTKRVRQAVPLQPGWGWRDPVVYVILGSGKGEAR